MSQAITLPFANWQNFYVIVGSSAGALTGLQFVVLTLIAQTRSKANMREIRAFGTPTVVHFCTALLVSALMEVPWDVTINFGICLAVCGTLGIAYSVRTIWHAHKATYNPDLEDWIWYTALPTVAHLALLVAAMLVWFNSQCSLPVVAVITLLFLLLGIHNSWDTVTYIVIQQDRQVNEAARD